MLTNAQHARLDSLAQVTSGPMAEARVVGLAPGNCPIVADAHGRKFILERTGELLGHAIRPVCKIRRRRLRPRYPVTRMKLTPAERERYERGQR